MRVLVTWGSRLGGTEGIAHAIGEELRRDGMEVDLQPASAIHSLKGYDAAIVGGALYANRWHRAAYHFVTHHIAALRRIPVWLFSSGPLDDSADKRDIAPAKQVKILMERVGALGHTTFGGRLPADAKGFPAEAMAKKRSGDWRNMESIRAWAAELANRLPSATPGPAVEPQGRSLGRLLAYGAAGWALCGIVMAGLMQIAPIGVAVAVHAVAAPIIFAVLSIYYFRARGAREALPVALAFTALVAILDAGIVAGLIMRDFAMFASVWGTWVPFALIFAATWITGYVMSMMPTPAQRAEWTKTPKAA